MIKFRFASQLLDNEATCLNIMKLFINQSHSWNHSYFTPFRVNISRSMMYLKWPHLKNNSLKKSLISGSYFVYRDSLLQNNVTDSFDHIIVFQGSAHWFKWNSKCWHYLMIRLCGSPGILIELTSICCWILWLDLKRKALLSCFERWITGQRSFLTSLPVLIWLHQGVSSSCNQVFISFYLRLLFWWQDNYLSLLNNLFDVLLHFWILVVPTTLTVLQSYEIINVSEGF